MTELPTELPTVSASEDIQQQTGKRVRLVGRYIQIDVRMRQVPPPVYNGHVAIALEDQTEVLLYPIWDSQAKRPPEEIARYENLPVAVIGTVLLEAPDSPEDAANLCSPCLVSVESIVQESRD
jgi:hypothetical protein